MRLGCFPLWTDSQIGGIATYDNELLPALARLAPQDEFHVYSPTRRAIARLNLNRDNVKHHLLFPSSRWINVPFSFPLATAFSSLDLLHMTHVPPPLSAKPYVMTLHCYSTFLHPEFHPRGLNTRMNLLLRRGLQAAKVVLCVSRGLMELAQSELKVDRERLAFAYHGVSERFQPKPKAEAALRVRRAYGLERPYLLFIGVIGPRKNCVRLVEAYDLFRKETGSKVQLVMAGRKWLAQDVDETIRKLGLEKDVIYTGFVDDNDLPDLYSAAELFVFPSLWESFGIPLVESMACGTPVLTSRGSCLPEIAGDAAVLVDPYSVANIAEGIAKVLGDPELSETLRIRGFERARQFSWSNCALQTLDAYRRAMHS